MKKQMEYANRRGIPCVVIVGSRELEERVATIKDMTSGEQTKLSFEDTLSRITQGLSQRNQGKVILEK